MADSLIPGIITLVILKLTRSQEQKKEYQATCGKGNAATTSTAKSDLKYFHAISLGFVTRSPLPNTLRVALGLIYAVLNLIMMCKTYSKSATDRSKVTMTAKWVSVPTQEMELL